MGSGVGFHGDYGEIYHASDSIVDNAEGFLHNLDVLESLMSSLRSNWTGDSATEYNRSKNRNPLCLCWKRTAHPYPVNR